MASAANPALLRQRLTNACAALANFVLPVLQIPILRRSPPHGPSHSSAAPGSASAPIALTPTLIGSLPQQNPSKLCCHATVMPHLAIFAGHVPAERVHLELLGCWTAHPDSPQRIAPALQCCQNNCRCLRNSCTTDREAWCPRQVYAIKWINVAYRLSSS